jgi:hypothetical protein
MEMKKFILSAVFAVALGLNVNAQVVISNDFGTPVGNADDLNSDVNWSWNDEYHRRGSGFGNSYDDDYDYDDPYFYVGASWYLNEATNVFGVNAGYQRWNNFGGELNVMTDQSFEKFYDFNLSANWSFGLWKTGSSMGMLTFALGPSFYMYKGADDKYENQVDLVVDPRLVARINHILISAGYQQRFCKFKFTKEYTPDAMFHLGIAYCF